jgi:MFS family permease
MTADLIRPRAVTTGLFLANGIAIGAWASAIPPIKLALGLSDAQLGIALLAFAGGAILTMTVSGHIAARFGSARVVLLASFASATVLLPPALMPNWPSLVVSVLLFGACNGAMDVTMNGHGALVERAWNRPIMSSFHAAWSLGCLLGSASGGKLLSLGYGPFVAMAAASATAFVLALAAVPNIRIPGPEIPRSAEPRVGLALPSRAILAVGALAFLCMFTEGAIGDWAGVYLNTVVGVSTAAAAAGFGSFAFAMATGRLIGDRVVKALGRPRVVTIGAGFATIGLTLTLLFPRIEIAMAGYVMAGLGIANIVPVLFSAGGRRTPNHPAIGVAMAATCGYAGLLISPPLIGLFANEVGLRVALIVLVVAIVTVAIAAWRALRE